MIERGLLDMSFILDNGHQRRIPIVTISSAKVEYVATTTRTRKQYG